MGRNLMILKMVLLSISIIVVISACGGKPVTTEGETQGTTEDSATWTTQEATKEPIKMVFGSTSPSANHINVNAYVPWSEYVAKETDGQIQITVQPNGVLGGAKEALQDIGGRTYDIGSVLTNYYPDTPLFIATAIDLPFAFINAEDHLQVYEVVKKYEEEFKLADAYEKMGVKLLGQAASDGYAFISKEPIRTVEDLKGKKVRVAASSWVPIIKSWGAIPVSINFADGYTALERGSLDVMVFSAVGTLASKFHEVAPYITDVSLLNFGSAIVMNAEQYNKLSDDLKKKFDGELGNKVVDLVMASYNSEKEKNYAIIAKEIKGKGEIIRLTPEERATFMEPAKAAWQEWVNSANKLGYDGKAALNGLVRIMKEEGIEPPFELDFLE